MSGLHTSINTHISDGFEDSKGNLIANMTYFYDRIGYFPDRIKNLHLIYAFVVKAVVLTRDTIIQQDFKTGQDELYDSLTASLVKNLMNKITG